MLSGGVDIFVAQHIGNKIDITGFLIQGSAVGTAKLMRRNFFGCGRGSVFFTRRSTDRTVILVFF